MKKKTLLAKILAVSLMTTSTLWSSNITQNSIAAIRIPNLLSVVNKGNIASDSNIDSIKDNIATKSNTEMKVNKFKAYTDYNDTVSDRCGDNLTWTYNFKEDTMTISGTGEMWDEAQRYYFNYFDNRVKTIYPEIVIIEYGVTSISNNAFGDIFEGNHLLTTVSIPNSVTSIGEGAFCGCTSLTNITIPNSVTSIGEGAFSSCTSLTNITIPDSITNISNGLFSDCNNLTNITIPKSVTSIGEYAFDYCISLTNITIPNTINGIPDYAFRGCNSLTNITIPNSVTSIGEYVFEGCNSLTNISIPNSVTSIGAGTFENCSNLASITLSNKITKICDNMFNGCSNLTDISIPDSVTSINYRAFFDCSNLRTISIPDNVTVIGGSAFDNCISLTSIRIPESIKFILNSAFNDCSNLTDIYYAGNITQWNQIDISDKDELNNAAIYYLKGAVVGLFREWNEQTREAQIGNSILNYLVTDETILPEEDLGHFVGEYVLVTSDTGDDDFSYSKKNATSIQPVVSGIGTVSDKSAFSVTIDDVSYKSIVNNSLIVPYEAVYHLYKDTVVSIMPLEYKKGVFNEWNASGEAVIDRNSYPVSKLTDKSFLNNMFQFIGWNVKYSVLDGILLRVVQIDSEQTQTKQFESYDTSSRRVFFTDDTSYLLDDTATLDLKNIKQNYWVSCTLKNTSKGIRLTKLKKVNADIDLSIWINNSSKAEIEYNKGKFRFVGDKKYEGAASFKIPFSVTVNNKTQVKGVSQNQLQSDPSLSFTVNNIFVNDPDGFNFGLLKGGAVKLEKPVKLMPGESVSVKGYIRPDAGYKLNSAKKQGYITATADTSLRTQTNTSSFTIIDVQQEETEKNVIELTKAASRELSSLNVNLMTLNDDVMGDLGFNKEDIELFKKEILTQVILSNTPKKTFKEKVNDKILSKVFSYKTHLGAVSYSFPLQYVIETPKYGTVNLELTCKVNKFSLDGNDYGCTFSIDYKIVSDKPMLCLRKGVFGQAAYPNVEAFAESAYNLVEEELKKQYNDVWGNSANQVGKFLFGDTVTKILEQNDTSYSDIAWKIMTWPAKNIKNSCPTNVYIYNNVGELCGSIENGQITKTCDDFELSVEGDVKYITGIRDEYNIEYMATDNGVMDVEITEFSDYETSVRKLSYYDIPLNMSKTYKQSIDKTALLVPERYNLISDTNEEIFPDKDEIFLSFISTDENLEQKINQKIEGTERYIKDFDDEAFYLDAKLVSGNGTLSYVSSNPDIATVSDNGLVTIISSGQTEITITASETSEYQSCEFKIIVTVSDKSESPNIPVTSVDINIPTGKIMVGDKVQLTAIIQPNNATDKSVIWTSSDESTATISSDGIVTAIKSGTVNITLKSATTDSLKKTITLEIQNKSGGSSSGSGSSSGGGSSSGSGKSSGGRSRTKSNTQSTENGTITIDAQKGYINSLTGIITGTEEGYSRWQQDKNGWNFLYANGTFALGTNIIDAMGEVHEQVLWEQINGAWYAFGADGYAKFGFVYDYSLSGWFYVDINKGMLIEWQFIDDNWYYFNPVSDGTKGKMLSDTWIGEYYLNPSGIWEISK